MLDRTEERTEGLGGTKEPAQLTKPDYTFGTLAELADAVHAEGRK